jgi:predicted nucleic acid-binding protein
MARLSEATSTAHHEYWPDDISLLDPGVADPTRIHGPRQVTDVYLLALAVRHNGRFVTFDAAVPLAAVRGAEAAHLVVL